MIELDKARQLAATVDDNSIVTVSGSWLRQVIREISEGRAALTAALDFRSIPEIPPLDLSAPSGAFTTLVTAQRRRVPASGH